MIVTLGCLKAKVVQFGECLRLAHVKKFGHCPVPCPLTQYTDLGHTALQGLEVQTINRADVMPPEVEVYLTLCNSLLLVSPSLGQVCSSSVSWQGSSWPQLGNTMDTMEASSDGMSTSAFTSGQASTNLPSLHPPTWEALLHLLQMLRLHLVTLMLLRNVLYVWQHNVSYPMAMAMTMAIRLCIFLIKKI